MKKTYVLDVEGKNRDRLLDASKNDIRKYFKRERAKALPEGVDFWDFDCKLGIVLADAVELHPAALTAAIDPLVAGGAAQFYVEVSVKPGHRVARPMVEPSAEVQEHQRAD